MIIHILKNITNSIQIPNSSLLFRCVSSKTIMAYDVRTKYEIPSFLRL